MMDNKFTDFLETVDDRSRDFAAELNEFLLDSGYKCDIKAAKSGYTVSYIHPQTKKTLATFVCRKSGTKLRIYPAHLSRYECMLDTLPEKMKKDIKKSSICKRLINPDDCNPRCAKGYSFTLDGERYQKCRYMAFMPALTPENNPHIKSLLENEIKEDEFAG